MSQGVTLPRDWYCAGHVRKVAEDKSINSVAWPLALLELALLDDRIMRRCGGDPSTGKLADAGLLSVVLGEIGPLCCFLSSVGLESSYEMARHPERIKGFRKSGGAT